MFKWIKDLFSTTDTLGFSPGSITFYSYETPIILTTTRDPEIYGPNSFIVQLLLPLDTKLVNKVN